MTSRFPQRRETEQQCSPKDMGKLYCLGPVVFEVAFGARPPFLSSPSQTKCISCISPGFSHLDYHGVVLRPCPPCSRSPKQRGQPVDHGHAFEGPSLRLRCPSPGAMLAVCYPATEVEVWGPCHQDGFGLIKTSIFVERARVCYYPRCPKSCTPSAKRLTEAEAAGYCAERHLSQQPWQQRDFFLPKWV